MSVPARLPDPDPLRQAIDRAALADETDLTADLMAQAKLDERERAEVEDIARALVEAVRAGRRKRGWIDAFMQEYALSSEEGVVLMCLAEALLRIPDSETADKLIKDKIGSANWEAHLGQSESLFVNASSWGLMLTGNVVRLSDSTKRNVQGTLGKLVNRSGEPFIRQAMLHAMRILGKQFVLGRTMKEALRLARPSMAKGIRYSFDMLGEAAYTEQDAKRYFDAYQAAIASLAQDTGEGELHERHSVSVKLSALHPRYEETQRDRVMADLVPRVVILAGTARDAGLGLTIDAEESDRLDLQLDVLEAVGAALPDYEGLGLAVQAYQRRALPVVEWVADLARRQKRRIPVRLVKGAYWDTEIKRAQMAGLDSYPVFTRKSATDVSYLACARKMLAHGDVLYPQFASHNAHTVAAVQVMAGTAPYELQRLHGMGEPLYEEILAREGNAPTAPVRIYAPVGGHEDLLAYLVRRLLENGANTSFVNRLGDDEAPIEDIIADPVDALAALKPKPHPNIPAPADLYRDRINSKGVWLEHRPARQRMYEEIESGLRLPLEATPLIAGEKFADSTAQRTIRNPADTEQTVGTVQEAQPFMVDRAIEIAVESWPAWDRKGGPERAVILDRAAEFYERDQSRLVGLMVREGGKTLRNALADHREAVDFLRYYALQARLEFGSGALLNGPTGEENRFLLRARGVFGCIAPWNFPLAIFTGEVAAALAAGNAALAKPAEQTPLIAYEAVKLMLAAGVPPEVLHFLPGTGPEVGGRLVHDKRVDGIAFTGGTDTAHMIQRNLAGRGGAIPVFIAETGGLNAMIVDSTALPEQAVRDIMVSAFDSAGQRCSALRLLFVQKDIAPKLLPMLKGAMAELKVGDPMDFATDVGPVIDRDALDMLEGHAAQMHRTAETLLEVPLPKNTERGTFFAPRAYKLSHASELEREFFGPILHIVTYSEDRLDEVIEGINKSGYGLTLGIHSRIEETARYISARARCGNIYVNRNQVGAVVGVQPFGGQGLSGTGPKAGGPHYLHRFAVERVISTDTTAAGGNAALMTMEDR